MLDLSAWEELAETLLADFSREVAGDAKGGRDQVTAHAGALPRLSGQLVGSRTVGLEPARKSRSVSHDHAYFSANEEEEEGEPAEDQIDRSNHGNQAQQVTSSSSSGNKIAPTSINAGNCPASETIVECETLSMADNENMVFGTYDETTNCITIFMPEEKEVESSSSSSSSQEISVDTIKSFAAPLEPCLSPLSSLSVIESGYESFIGTGSPDSDHWSNCDTGERGKDCELDDLWNDSFSELFPSLV